MPKVSVIIPTFNSDKYLITTINSVLHQTYRDFEIIVVDDGSMDNTQQIMKTYIDQFPEKIRYFYQENKGVSTARNKGLRESSGKFVTFLDADDIWDKDFILKMISSIEYSCYDWIVCDNYRITLDNKENEIERTVQKRHYLEQPALYKELLRHDDIGGPSKVIIKKECILKVNGFDEKLIICEDWDLWIRLAKERFKLGYIREPLYFYVIRNTSLTKRNKIKSHESSLLLIKKYKKKVIKEFPEFKIIYGEMYWKLGREALYELNNLRLGIKCVFYSLLTDFNFLRLARIFKQKKHPSSKKTNENRN